MSKKLEVLKRLLVSIISNFLYFLFKFVKNDNKTSLGRITSS